MSTDTKMQENNETNTDMVRGRETKAYWLDWVIIVVMGTLMVCGASWQIFGTNTDVAKYQCYASAFLHGVQSVKSYPHQQCDFITHIDGQTYTNAKVATDLQKYGAPGFLVNFVRHQNISHRFQALPHEYPILTLIPFLLVILVRSPWYQIAFAILMVALASGTYFILLRYKSRKVAIVGAALLVIGGWGTIAGRFDLVPSLLTLSAVVLAERKRWTWAFVALALAFLVKFYPVVFLLPFLVGQQMQERSKWNAWSRWQPLAAFIGVCVLVMGVSLLLSVEGTISPLSYFQTRPVQVESLDSSLVWLASLVAHHKLSYNFNYHSLNVNLKDSYFSLISKLDTILELAGFLYTAWLQWRKKIDLATATLLILLVVLVTGKVFSPQYIIWVVPLVAYVGGASRRWIVSWVAICGLTTFIYPYIYYMSHTGIVRVPLNFWFYPSVTLRNFLMFGFLIALFVYYSRRQVLPTSVEDRSTSEASSVSA